MVVDTGREALIFALDVATREDAEALADKLSGRVGMFKVGLELFTSVGPDVVKAVRDRGVDVFLDLKFHDIPATASRAAAAAARLGVKMMTVHAAGGARMVASAVQSAHEAAEAAGFPAPDVVAVTALTSMSQRELSRLNVQGNVDDWVLHLAKLAAASGADGVVASGQEVARIKRISEVTLNVVTPGVRPDWFESSADDQSRIVTPGAAASAGADYVVVGRPIRDAEDPAVAADRISEELGKGLAMRTVA